MESTSSLEQIKSELHIALEKLREAEKNENSCMAKQDFNTAAYWSQIYKDTWDEYTRLIVSMNKNLGEWEYEV